LAWAFVMSPAKTGPSGSPPDLPRDRWFHGVHAHSMAKENFPSSSPAKTASPTTLKDLDVYGTLREKHVRLTSRQIRVMYDDVRERTLRVLGGLTPAQVRATPEPSVNPFDWGIGHLAHFYEYMILALLAPDFDNEKTFLPGHDKHALFDSFRANHADRWNPLGVVGTDPTLTEVHNYLSDVTDRLKLCLGTSDRENELLDPVTTYLHTYGILHEHWHVEDFVQTRHTLGYSAPATVPTNNTSTSVAANCWGGFVAVPNKVRSFQTPKGGALPGYVTVPAGRYTLGAQRDDAWVFDAERWGHEIAVPSFRLAKACVTNREFLVFVNNGGYDAKKFWSHEGWRWLSTNKSFVSDPKNANVSPDEACRTGKNTKAPRYWTRPFLEKKNGTDEWFEFLFDAQTPTPLRPHAPVTHVTWYEAEAYCAWVGGRLPTEAEWEVAARTTPTNYLGKQSDAAGASGASGRRLYPWGSDPPTIENSNLDGFTGGTTDVAAYPSGESGWGCRGMLGNVWEWTQVRP